MRSARRSISKLPVLPSEPKGVAVASASQADGSGISKEIVPRHPPWLKVRMPSGDTFFDVRRLVRDQQLHTVCESASCPNIGECWSQRELTIMILGNVCTRSCQFCDVPTGRPL